VEDNARISMLQLKAFSQVSEKAMFDTNDAKIVKKLGRKVKPFDQEEWGTGKVAASPIQSTVLKNLSCF
jgi:hypothetical protein